MIASAEGPRMWIKLFIVIICLSTAMVFARDEEAVLPFSGVRRPAEVYFGAYRRNEPLAEHPDQWPFVRAHADGFLMHFGFWLNNDYQADPVATARKLGPILRDAKLKTLLEIGFPSRNAAPELVVDMGRKYGELYAGKIKRFEAETGLRVDEIECELRLFIFKDIARVFPDWSASEISQQVTGRRPSKSPPASRAERAYWPEFLEVMRRELGERPLHVGCPPVYVPWKGLFTAADEFKFVHPVPGKDKDAPTIEIPSKPFWDAMLNEQTAGFICDSPWYLMEHPVYTERGYRRKIVDFERYVHRSGKRFTFIVNNDVDKKLPPDEWDQRYLQDSMKALTTFQLDGGRADRYVLESWYAGPYTIVPEDQLGTFTNLVKAAILYLKGPSQNLELSVDAALPRDVEGKRTVTIRGNRVEVRLTNTGTSVALPAIRVAPARSDAPRQYRATMGDQEVTVPAATSEGAVPSQLLQPGESMTLTIEGRQDVQIEAYWNPQDPAGTPRDVFFVHFAP